MLDKEYKLVESYRMAREKIIAGRSTMVKLRLIGKRGKDGRTYNIPFVFEVAASIVGDIDEAMGHRDIIVECKSLLKRISELHPSYLALQYHLLFPYADDGYWDDIPFSSAWHGTARTRISLKEFFGFRQHEKSNESPFILYYRRLFQQFVVDAYIMMEAGRLRYVRTQQQKLWCDLYKGSEEAVVRGETDPSRRGKRVILPSSFTGGAR